MLGSKSRIFGPQGCRECTQAKLPPRLVPLRIPLANAIACQVCPALVHALRNSLLLLWFVQQLDCC